MSSIESITTAAKIHFESAAIATCVSNIKKYNGDLDTEYNSAYTKMSNLNSTWTSSVGMDIVQRFKTKAEKHNENRHDNIQNLVKFLNKQVKENYEDMEKSLKSAADAFH